MLMGTETNCVRDDVDFMFTSDLGVVLKKASSLLSLHIEKRTEAWGKLWKNMGP